MSDTLLSRISSSSLQTPLLTSHQNQVDALVSHFAEQVTDWRSIAAMTVGGGAYRLGRIGVMSTGSGLTARSVPLVASLVRGSSLVGGLATEVVAFEATHRSLFSATGERNNPNLWNWNGQGGIRQGLAHSFITFGTLRGVGAMVQGENIVVQHLLQDTAMVTGHQLSAAFGITNRPTGSLVEQFLEAEVTNIQMTGGMSLVHGLAPGVTGLEHGLDLAVRSSETGLRLPLLPVAEGLLPALASATGFRIDGRRSENSFVSDHIMMMEGERGDRASEPPTSSVHPVEPPPREEENAPPSRPPSEILSELGRILNKTGETMNEPAVGAEATREQLRNLSRLAEEHPQVLNEIASLVDTIRRYPSIGESLQPVLKILNEGGRSTKGALSAAQRELQKIIHENPELRLQAENFMRLKHLIPNALTYSSIMTAIMGIIYSSHGDSATAAKLLIFAAVIDKVDGVLARALRATHEMGARLDSYADFANYGPASAMFAYCVLNQHGESMLAWGAALIIGGMAAIRLPTFDFLDSNPLAIPPRDILGNPIQGHGKDFLGMPSTMMGLILPALYWTFGQNNPDIFYGLSALSGVAMYSPLRYGKLTDGILGGIGRKVIQTIRNPVKLAVSGAAAGILAYLGYRFPEVSAPLLKVGVLGGLGTYVASPGIEAFSRLFASNNNNNHVSPTPPPVLVPPKIDEGALPSLPPLDGVAPGRTPIPGDRDPKSRR
jgi:phosphatidylserine synthase